MGKKKQPISKERMIEIIEAKIQDPNVSPRDLASLSKRLANLRGFIQQGVYTRKPQSQPEPPAAESLPSWWPGWVEIFICRRVHGLCDSDVFVGLEHWTHGHGFEYWIRELDRYESEWAKREGFSSVEELREALRLGASEVQP